MNNTLFIAVMFFSLLSACAERDAAIEKAQETTAIEVSIDTTPIQALAVGGTVNLLQQSGADFSAPNSEVWQAAQEYSVDLSVAPPVHQSINLRYDPATPAVPVNFRAASDGDKLYLRLRWADASRDTTTSREEFSDGAAVQFALGGGPTTSYMMGATSTPVNIWYWKAGAEQPQNLAAGGFGSTTRLEQGQLSANSIYRDSDEWVVVFSRPLEHEGEHQADLKQTTLTIALALWQGDAKQRDGLKHVSPGWITIQ